MEMYCIKCSAPLGAFDNYCSYCGAETPRGTIIPDLQPCEIEDGVYCPHCAHVNHKDALFCASCGIHLYEKPSISPFTCPQCSKKNSVDAAFCYSCRLHFKEWFSMRGEIAKDLGYEGDFILFETMNTVFYHFINTSQIKIGRGEDNDLVLPSGWASGRHCILDLKKWRLIDHGSTNGTYINRKGDKINSVSLNTVREFNIAGVFTFTVIRSGKLFIYRLTAILDEDGLQREGCLDLFNELRNHYYIIIGGEGTINIRKMDGEILTSSDEKMEYFAIDIQKNGYFFTDEDRDIQQKLLLKKYNNLPVNWQVTLKENNG